MLELSQQREVNPLLDVLHILAVSDLFTCQRAVFMTPAFASATLTNHCWDFRYSNRRFVSHTALPSVGSQIVQSSVRVSTGFFGKSCFDFHEPLTLA